MINRHLHSMAWAATMSLALAFGTSAAAQQQFVIKKQSGNTEIRQQEKQVKKGDLKATYANMAKQTGSSARVMTAKDMRMAPKEDFSTWELVLSEDFSKWTAGSEDTPDETPVDNYAETGDPYISDEMMQTPGWSGVCTYQAGGACALAYPGQGGALNTPLGNWQGRIGISFRAKALDTKAQLFFVMMVKGDIWNPQPVNDDMHMFQITSDEGWVDIEVIGINPYADEDAFIQINAMAYNSKGILIDDLKIYRDPDYLVTPNSLSADSFVNDGFTAHWPAVTGAESYLLNLWEETEAGDPVNATETFDGINATDGVIDADSPNFPEGWNISLANNNVTTDGMDGSQALLLNSQNDTIEMPTTGGKLVEFGFSYKTIAAQPESSFTIEVLQNGVWSGIIAYYASQVDESYYTVDLRDDLENNEYIPMPFAGVYDGVRIITDAYFYEGSVVAIDNITYETTAPTQLELVREDEEYTDNFAVLEGLDPELNYYFTVKAAKGDNVSEESEMYYAYGVAAPAVKEATDIDPRGGYTANWDFAPKATGYIVTSYQVYKATADEAGHAVLDDDFTSVESEGTPETPSNYGNGYEYISLDELTTSKGWTGIGVALANGMIGCNESQYVQFTLQSPIIDLNNGDGKFKVTITAWGREADALTVQCCDAITGEQIGVTDFIEFKTQGLNTATLEFEGGTENTVLLFYTYNFGPFFIDEIKVEQDLKKDEQVFTYLSQTEVDGAENSCRISGLTRSEDLTYAYNVVSIREEFSNYCTSDYSDKAFVSLKGNVESAGNDEAANAVYANGNTVNVILTEDAEINVYNTAGQKVLNIAGTAGANSFDLNGSGIYIVTIDGKAYKVTINE